MKIIKLDAIDSTNTFLKGLNQNQATENYTIVTANSQFAGKGQMGSKWESEIGKNLTMSILIKNIPFEISSIFKLNIIITCCIIRVLKKFEIPNLNIKWPNDILAGNKKIAGILIENTLKNNSEIDSVIGIGMNVNQLNFDELPKASSLQAITKIEYNIDQLALEIGTEIEKTFTNTITENFIKTEKDSYHQLLFKKGTPAVFETQKHEKFMGIIQRVSDQGLLEVMLENDIIKQFNIKEISMLY